MPESNNMLITYLLDHYQFTYLAVALSRNVILLTLEPPKDSSLEFNQMEHAKGKFNQAIHRIKRVK